MGPAGCDHVGTRGMYNLRHVATALYLFKIHSVVATTITFAAQRCATLGPYIINVPIWSIGLGGMLLRPTLSLIQMFFSGLSPWRNVVCDPPLRKARPLHKIFIELVKQELNDRTPDTGNARTPVKTLLNDSNELVVMMSYLKLPSSYANAHLGLSAIYPSNQAFPSLFSILSSSFFVSSNWCSIRTQQKALILSHTPFFL